jgi:hypothetical protein
MKSILPLSFAVVIFAIASEKAMAAPPRHCPPASQKIT